MWAGNINTDYSRSTPHCTIVKQSVEEMDMKTFWDRFEVDFNCTYQREETTYISTLDHFLLSESIFQTVLDARPIHHPEDTSDHEPIYCVIKSITLARSTSQPSTYRPRPSWRMAGQDEKEQYRFMLDTELGAIMIPTQLSECQDTHCMNKEHLEAVDWFAAETMEAVQRAGEMTLPFPKAGKSEKKVTPGFKEKVSPFKENAYFWHSGWKSAGRPLNNQVHIIMKKTRNRYHLRM